MLHIKEKTSPKIALNKIQLIIFYFTCLLFFSFIIRYFSSFTLQINLLRNLQISDSFGNENPTKRGKIKESETIDPIILGFFIFFIIFIFLSLYIIYEIKKIIGEQLSEEIRIKVWIFIYISNNCFFFTALSYSPMIHDLSVGYLTLIGSGTIFVIGTIIFIKHLFDASGRNCLGNFLVLETLKSYFRIPSECVWNFISLTDPCCRITQINTYVENGRIKSDRQCVECWNSFISFFKRFIFIISFFFFYVSLIYITALFLILKLIYWIIISISECFLNSRDNQNLNTGNNVDVINNNGNIPNIENKNIGKVNNLANENIERFEEKNKKQISRRKTKKRGRTARTIEMGRTTKKLGRTKKKTVRRPTNKNIFFQKDKYSTKKELSKVKLNLVQKINEILNIRK